MAIQRLNLQNFRNIHEITIEPCSGFNYICGANGSGKTSILEAIYCLGRGKSFRTHLSNQVITKGQEKFLVVGRVVRAGREFSIGVQRNKTTIDIRLNGKPVGKAGNLAHEMPLTVLESGLHTIIDGAPEQRRRFLDWGVFHVEREFHSTWQRFRRTLAQRNASIKSGWSKKTIIQWDKELVEVGEKIDQFRKGYLRKLIQTLEPITKSFEGLESITLNYQSGWKRDTPFKDYLFQHIDSDIDRGFTQFGPHRADLRIQTPGGLAKDILSRGQQKLCMASLVLAQCRQLSEQGIQSITLVDDLAAELDTTNRLALIQILIQNGGQVFITGTEGSFFNELDVEDKKMFHVEQGKAIPVEPLKTAS